MTLRPPATSRWCLPLLPPSAVTSRCIVYKRLRLLIRRLRCLENERKKWTSIIISRKLWRKNLSLFMCEQIYEFILLNCVSAVEEVRYYTSSDSTELTVNCSRSSSLHPTRSDREANSPRWTDINQQSGVFRNTMPVNQIFTCMSLTIAGRKLRKLFRSKMW